ncbi:MAG TPA: hypothetical protein PKH40_00380 [Treponemataceae bacterium]|nr:hypothetical protein [Treponemataceae bacterium]
MSRKKTTEAKQPEQITQESGNFLELQSLQANHDAFVNPVTIYKGPEER